MSDPIRVVVPLDSQSKEAWETALAYAVAICKKQSATDVVLLTHTKSQITQTSLATLLGRSVVRALGKGPVSISGNRTLRAETKQTLKWVSKKTVIVAYYAEQSILDFVDGFQNVVGVVAVPDILGGADVWAQRWGANVHGQASKKPSAPLIEDQTVVRALNAMNSIINVSTGLLNPRDKEHANTILRILRAKGHSDPSENIKSWAIRNNWKPKHAEELEKLSQKIWSLKRKPSLSGFYNVEERYRHWSDGEG